MIVLEDQKNSEDLNHLIDGLAIVPNRVTSLSSSHPIGVKVTSSEGPGITDMVTHEKGFTYNTSGIHIGQDDRLTFFYPRQKMIHGIFVDFRKQSPTFGSKIELSFATSVYRHLVIPRGVSHSFSNLEGVVTRDEPIWYVDDKNPFYDVTNDLIATPVGARPQVDHGVVVNQNRLPTEGHRIFSQLQRQQLSKPLSYSQRMAINVGGSQTFVTIEDIRRSRSHDILDYLPHGTPIKFGHNLFAYTGHDSYTLVPQQLPLRYCDILIDMTSYEDFIYHKFTDQYLTMLSLPRDHFAIDYIDVETQAIKTIDVPFDPRIYFAIPKGTPYRLRGIEQGIMRAQSQIFLPYWLPIGGLGDFHIYKPQYPIIIESGLVVNDLLYDQIKELA